MKSDSDDDAPITRREPVEQRAQAPRRAAATVLPRRNEAAAPPAASGSEADDSAPETKRDPVHAPAPWGTARPASRHPGGTARRAYVVDFTYREPGYAARSGTNREYSARFAVQALDENEAVARAKAQFEEIARQSSVGWARIIHRVQCREA